MKASELMIGDWVRFSYPHHETGQPIERIFKVTEIEAQLGSYYVWSEEKGRMCHPERLQPIPLTPEILEKNGFSLVEVGDNGTGTPSQYRNRFERWLLKTTRKDVALWYDRLAKYYHVATMQGARLHYIHELQHALRLCGIEKEIEL